MMSALHAFSIDIALPAIARTLLDGGLTVLIVWTVCRVCRWISPAVAAALWWLAALKLMVALVWTTPLELRVLPAAEPVAAAVVEGDSATAPVTTTLRRSSADTPPAAPRTPFWPIAAMSLWVAGGVAGLLHLAVGGTRARRVRRGARPASEDVDARAERLALNLGMEEAPRVVVSGEIASPQVSGLLSPTILLPKGFSALDRRQQDLALCHELVHVRRRDLWLGWVPAVAERVLFFNPFAHLAAREYALSREAACDAEVVRLLEAAPQEYGRLLLSLGVMTPTDRLAAAGAPRSFTTLKRRLTMLNDVAPSTRRVRLIGWALVALALCTIVPVRLVARPLPEAAAAASAELGVRAVAPASPTHAHAVPSSPIVAAPAVPHAAAAMQGAPDHADRVEHRSAQRPDDDGTRWVILDDESRMHMSGWGEDSEHARRFRRDQEPLMWFRRGGKEYVIRDAGMVREAENLFRPLGEIGAKQAEIGRQQGEIGRKLGEIGAKQGAIGARQGALGAKQAAIGLKQALADLERQTGEKSVDREELDGQMKELKSQVDELSKQMDALSPSMEELGKQMEPLGKQMEEFGRQMEEASKKADAQVRELMDRAIASGAAEAVK